MTHLELINKLIENKNSKVFLCSKLGSGKTTLLNYLNKELAENFEKYHIIPLFVDATQLAEYPEPIINYLVSEYTPISSENEYNLDRISLFKECLQSDNGIIKYLLIIDSTEFIDKKIMDNALREIKCFNKFASLSILFSSSRALDFRMEFEEYDYVKIDSLNNDRIVAYLNKNDMKTDMIESSWEYLLSTPWFLKAYVKVYNTKANDFTLRTAITHSTLMSSYLQNIINSAYLSEKEIIKNFFDDDLPEYAFKSKTAKIEIPKNRLYNEKMLNLIFEVKEHDNSELYACKFSHEIWHYYFKAKYLANRVISDPPLTVLELLNRQKYDEEILTFLGEQLKLKNDNRKISKLNELIDYLRKNRETCNVTEYRTAMYNILNTFCLNCSEQLSGLDLSYLDLTECNFVGINCQKTVFSNSVLKDTCFIPYIGTHKATHFAISDDGKYCVLAEDHTFGGEYCTINIRETENGELIHSSFLPNVYSVTEIDNEKYAIIYRDGSNNHLAIYKYKDSMCDFDCIIGSKIENYQLLGSYSGKLFFLENIYLFLFDMNTKEIMDYNVCFPLDEYSNYKVLTQQYNPSNNGVVLYNSNKTVDLIFISFDNILNKNFSSAIEYSISKFDENANMCFSDYEPIIAICNDEDYKIYNYRSQTSEPDELEDYINTSKIYCGKYILTLGDDGTKENISPELLEDTAKCIYSYKQFKIYQISNEKRLYFVDLESEKKVNFINQHSISQAHSWENIDYECVAVYNDGFKHFGNEGKRLLYDVESKKLKMEHVNVLSNYYKFPLINNDFLDQEYILVRTMDERFKFRHSLFSFDGNIKLYQVIEKNEYDFPQYNVFSIIEKIEYLGKIYGYPIWLSNDYNCCFVFIDGKHGYADEKFKLYSKTLDSNFCNVTEKIATYDLVLLHHGIDIKNNIMLLVQPKEITANDVISDNDHTHIIIYNYLKNQIIIDYKLPQHLFVDGHCYFEMTNQKIIIKCICFSKLYEYYFDFSGNLIDEAETELTWDSKFSNYYLSAFDVLTKAFLYFSELNCDIFDKRLLLLQKYSDFSGDTGYHYFEYFSFLIGAFWNDFTNGRLDYVSYLRKRRFVCVPSFSDRGNLLYFNGKIHFFWPNDIADYSIGLPEWRTFFSYKGYIHIRDVYDHCIMNCPIYDLDIYKAKFDNTIGLSDYAKRIIEMYSGEI